VARRPSRSDRGSTRARPKAYHRCRAYLTVTASATRDRDGAGGVVFHREDDGRITATDLETGLARGGDSRAEALAQLADVLALHEGDGVYVLTDDGEAYLDGKLDTQNGVRLDENGGAAANGVGDAGEEQEG
jgi:hypothetical protein